MFDFSWSIIYGATEEQLQLVHDLGSDHSAYILVVSAAAFTIFLWIQLVIMFYLRLVGYNEDGELGQQQHHHHQYQSVDVEEFELGDLSEEEEEEEEDQSGSTNNHHRELILLHCLMIEIKIKLNQKFM